MMFDLGPPPELWIPKKPAIIRAAPDLVIPAMPASYMPGVRGGAVPFIVSYATWYFQPNAATTTNIPGDAKVGDIAVLYDGKGSNDQNSLNTPANWTLITKQTGFHSAPYVLQAWSYKILAQGEPGALLSGDSQSWKAMFVFRPNKPITNVEIFGLVGVTSDGATGPITINNGGRSGQMIHFGAMISYPGAKTMTWSPTWDVIANRYTARYAAMKLHPPGNTTISNTMTSDGYNHVGGFGIKLTGG